MITRIVLGTNAEILNVSDVQEVIQNTGEYIKRALTINITKDEIGQLPTVSSFEELLRVENALSSIKIYKKDVLELVEENGEIIPTYGEEYLESEHTNYSTIQSIIKHSSGGMISVILIIDPIDISGEKARQLEQDTELKLAENTAETIETILILNEMQKVEQAESNAELIELMMMLQGGM